MRNTAIIGVEMEVFQADLFFSPTQRIK